ncbi:Epstein-Barr virus EBNA-1-like protein [Oryza sativa Japonica Group]|uniref:Epstein-Barr virus EBNA-1-like protein n=1 Tax=Oryza sativa subsp. japonica TaxID=39947 RepID=Q5VNX2_ORYSJ|nr:Epstein-Barr virus EBNA-1-like protein [Oryza sativa Japonica Group]
MSVWERGTDMGGQAGELALRLASKAATGGDAGERGKMEKRGKGGRERGLAPLPNREKEEGAGATRQGERRARPPSLGGLRAEWRGPGDDDGDDGGRYGAERRHERQARQALTTAATRRSATTARAHGRQRAASALARTRWLAGPSGCTAAGATERGKREGALGAAAHAHARAARGRGGEGGRGRPGERGPGRDGPSGIRPIEPREAN